MDSMDAAALRVLCEYNNYANRRLLDVACRLTEEQLLLEVSPSHSSMYELILHMFRLEAGFLGLCRGRRFEVPPELPLPELAELWDTLGEQTRAYLAEPGDLDALRTLPIKGQPLQFSPWQLMSQAFIHSTIHRGELSILLSEMGHPLPTMDIILQFAEQTGQVWPA